MKSRKVGNVRNVSAGRPTVAWSPLTAAIVLALTGGAATAQQVVPEEILVTGSRIVQSGMDTPTPVTSVSALELQSMAPGTLVEGMAQLPQFYGSTTTAYGGPSYFTTPGAGSLNLRGLATKRTLSLLNGRRVVSSTIYGGPDINLFPENILARVESVTGGATAAYGTDAVSGVVNFIVDTDFTGFKADVQAGETSRGDNDNHELSISGGFDIGERTHMLIAGETYRQDPVYTFEGRDWYKSWGRVRNNAPGAGSTLDNPQDFIAPYVISNAASYDGIIIFPAASGLPRMVFDENGGYAPLIIGSPNSFTGTNSMSVPNGSNGTDNNTDRQNLQPESSRDNVFLYVDHDMENGINIFGQVLYGKADFINIGSAGTFQAGANSNMTIFQNNAFLPASLRQLMVDNNIPSFQLGRIGHSSDISAGAYTEQDTETVSFTTGFNADIDSDGFFNGWNLDGYVQYGETDALASQRGGIRLDRIYLAVDAVQDGNGNIVCNVTLTSGLYPDCVPLNLFGRGNASAAAVDWVTGFDPGLQVTTTPYLPDYPPFTYSYTSEDAKVRDIHLEQTMFEFSASGPVAEGWAGPISMAFGVDWRKESVNQLVRASQGNPAADPFFLPVAPNNAALGIRGVPGSASNNSVEIQFSKVPFARGEFDVTEVFTEAIVPLLADKPAMQQLNFNGAIRWADYGGSGSVSSYKAGIDAAFTDQVRFRTTYSRDVRAATLGERFDRTGGTTNIQDYGENPTAPPTYQILTVQGGNPAVDPEEADTKTVGIVYRPKWAERFDLSVDWYDVDLTGSIESFTAQQIVDACYRLGDTDQCQYIERQAANNRISLVNQTFQNVAGAAVSGVDIEVDYGLMLGGGGNLNLRFLSSYLAENSITNAIGVTTERAGETGVAATSLPEWKHTLSATYSKGPLRAFVQGRFIDSGILSSTNNVLNTATGQVLYNVSDNTVDSAFYVDTRVSWTMDTRAGSIEIFGNVSNLLDEDPPIAATFGTFGAVSDQVNDALFDQLGRRYVVGFKLSL